MKSQILFSKNNKKKYFRMLPAVSQIVLKVMNPYAQGVRKLFCTSEPKNISGCRLLLLNVNE